MPPLELDALYAVDAPVAASGRPLLLRIDCIDEDPGQPRVEFEQGSLQELADSITVRGVLQPVSVRPHPQAPHRWLLNFGARRLRACRLAAKAEIPAFVDTVFDGYAQVVENEQREPLQPLELALFVQRRLALGDSQAEIGRLLGKSQSYVAFATALIDAPDWLMDLYREGRCRGLHELYQLRRLHNQAPSDVEAWSRAQLHVSRAAVRDLTARVEGATADARESESASSLLVTHAASKLPRTSLQPETRAKTRSLHLVALWQGVSVFVLVDDPPEMPGRIYVRPVDASERVLAAASELQLVGFEQVEPG